MRTLTFAVLVLFSITTFAETVEVDYKRFYSHVRKLNNEDTQALQFAFGFMHVREKQLCEITEANIVTQKKTIALPVTPEYRFTVPSEKALNLADAKVHILLTEPANLCDMSVQLETKPEFLKNEYAGSDLAFIHQQYTAFFNEMGSFLSFMMPTVKGLMVHFADENLNIVLASGHQIQGGMLILNDESLENLESLQLPQRPLRITALASR
ncbi:DUF2987 domain-containing protein [Alteromonas sediminis]|uniref:DUF2987 domain-containing protein n=1 Tax=Alteromonas sediminis TaxID=2259342 RepID=A0A3N5Y8K1_9ALTE|nr:DUF2987 domain-containing protein [Alteromonas sediminis]RPJ67409.1 DUF2987 domain-containing protein [Alteromonas sediminis]